MKNKAERLWELFNNKKPTPFLEDVRAVNALVTHALGFESLESEQLEQSLEVVVRHNLDIKGVFGVINKGTSFQFFKRLNLDKHEVYEEMFANYQRSFQYVAETKRLNLLDKETINQLREECELSHFDFYSLSGLINYMSLMELYSLIRKEAFIPPERENPQVFNDVSDRIWSRSIKENYLLEEVIEFMQEIISPSPLSESEEEELNKKLTAGEIQEIKDNEGYLHTRLFARRDQTGLNWPLSMMVSSYDLKDLLPSYLKKWDKYIGNGNLDAAIAFSYMAVAWGRTNEYKPLQDRFDNLFRLAMKSNSEDSIYNKIYDNLISFYISNPMTTRERFRLHQQIFDTAERIGSERNNKAFISSLKKLLSDNL